MFFDKVAKIAEASRQADVGEITLHRKMTESKVFEVIHDREAADVQFTEDERVWYNDNFILPFKNICIDHSITVGREPGEEERSLIFLSDIPKVGNRGLQTPRVFNYVAPAKSILVDPILAHTRNPHEDSRDTIAFLEGLLLKATKHFGYDGHDKNSILEFVDESLVAMVGMIKMGGDPVAHRYHPEYNHFDPKFYKWPLVSTMVLGSIIIGRDGRTMKLGKQEKERELCQPGYYPSGHLSQSDKWLWITAGIVQFAIHDLMVVNTPNRFIFEARPRHYERAKQKADSAKRILRITDRPRYIILKPGEIKKRMKISPKPGEPTGRKILYRRAHYKYLRSERFTNKRHTYVPVKAVWPHDTEVVIDNVRYRVHLGYRPDEERLVGNSP